MPVSPALLAAAIASRVTRLRELQGEALARALHDLKGLARLAGQRTIGELAHHAEDRLDDPGDALAALEDAARQLASAIGPEQITVGDLLATAGNLARTHTRVTTRGDALGAAIDGERGVRLAVMLAHLIGNALDHGLIPGDARGRIDLAASRDGAGLVVEVADNGRGVDSVAIRARALAAGVDPDDLLAALTHPGLTTRADVTLSAGRGQGLTAVRAAITELGGAMTIASSPGDGVRVSLTLPL